MDGDYNDVPPGADPSVDSRWYDDFLTSIGVNPNSASGTGNSPSNAEIETMIGLNPGITNLAGLWKALTQTPGGQYDFAKMIPLAAGLMSMTQSNKRTQPSGYQGGIPKYTAARQAPMPGQRLSGNVTYTKAAEGGELKSGGFVIPADVVSHFGNGSSDAGLKLLAAKIGAEPIRGDGDGMSDSIATTIDGREPAKVAHEEAYISPERVAELGGGDAKKGAQKLRSMMERIRQARTGTKEQGRQVNPSKFMPGGAVKSYESGGGVTGSAITSGLTGTESNLSNWAGPYVTDMLAKGQALSEMPYEQYTGQLTAGPSALQTQAFNTASSLQTPSAIGDAASTAGGIADALQNQSYTPTNFTNQYTAPTPYQAGTFTTDTFDTAQASKYMNPYLQMALDPQLAELQRQSKIALNDQMGKLTLGGAYGGGRQALVQSENTRNLMDKVNQVTGQGYNTAYQNAMSQFNADQGRSLQAQQFGEQSRQFGANQAMTAAQLQAQYGLSAQQAQEAAKQFGANFGLQSLQSALQAAQAQGNLGATEQQANLANLNTVAGLGATQRGISAEDIAAQKAAFEEARLNPYKMVQFQQSLLSGLPLAAQTYNLSDTNNLSQFAGGLASLAGTLKSLGVTPST